MASISVQGLTISAKHRLLQKIATVLRLIEVVVLAIMVSRFFAQLPVTARAVRDYLRDVLVSEPFLSPRLVFVVGSAITIALFAKSGQFSHTSTAAGGEESVTIAAAAAAMNTCGDQIKDSGWYDTREDCMTVEPGRTSRVLTRSATERPPESEREREKLLLRCYSEEHMSGEEFKKVVDAFIARQQRFLSGG